MPQPASPELPPASVSAERVESLRAQVRGDPDLELVVGRVEQIELLLEGAAELRAARSAAERAAAERKVAANRRALRAALTERPGETQG